MLHHPPSRRERHAARMRHYRRRQYDGRMALTIYMVQIATLDLLFSNYALHVTLTPLQALGTGLVFFALSAAFSRWWLARFRFGPFEWLWRSITYGQRQPWRIDARAATVGAT